MIAFSRKTPVANLVKYMEHIIKHFQIKKKMFHNRWCDTVQFQIALYIPVSFSLIGSTSKC